MEGVVAEQPWLWAGLTAYLLATLLAFQGVYRSRGGPVGAVLHQRYEHMVLLLLVAGVLLITVALAERWLRIGHGPFVNLFELLMSQLFSLGLVYSIAYWRIPVIRAGAVVVMPAIGVLAVWVLLLTTEATAFPPTYYNPWLWVHVSMGKIFLSMSLIGMGLAGVILLRGTKTFEPWFRHMPNDTIVDLLAWRFMLLAFIFESLMLIAGAVWAQDAWGRYWAWDALETSSFLNWLVLGMGLHARFTYRIPVRISSIVIFVVFIFAFLTYFGTPFFSEAAHKGVI